MDIHLPLQKRSTGLNSIDPFKPRLRSFFHNLDKMSALTFKWDGDARQLNALRQALKSKLPVLVLHNCTVEVNITHYDTEYILDRIKNVPVCSVSPSLVGKQLKLNVTNTTKEVRIVTPSDFEDGAELFPPTRLRTFYGG